MQACASIFSTHDAPFYKAEKYVGEAIRAKWRTSRAQLQENAHLPENIELSQLA
jgi:hypothetical protein